MPPLPYILKHAIVILTLLGMTLPGVGMACCQGDMETTRVAQEASCCHGGEDRSQMDHCGCCHKRASTPHLCGCTFPVDSPESPLPPTVRTMVLLVPILSGTLDVAADDSQQASTGRLDRGDFRLRPADARRAELGVWLI